MNTVIAICEAGGFRERSYYAMSRLWLGCIDPYGIFQDAAPELAKVEAARTPMGGAVSAHRKSSVRQFAVTAQKRLL